MTAASSYRSRLRNHRTFASGRGPTFRYTIVLVVRVPEIDSHLLPTNTETVLHLVASSGHCPVGMQRPAPKGSHRPQCCELAARRDAMSPRLTWRPSVSSAYFAISISATVGEQQSACRLLVYRVGTNDPYRTAEFCSMVQG